MLERDSCSSAFKAAGEKIPKSFQAPYLHTKVEEVGKLCLAAIFQEPCKSRNTPSASYLDDKYYVPIFCENQKQVAGICRELATAFAYAHDGTTTLTETNFVKSDKNYRDILKRRWLMLKKEIQKVFGDS